ncbi:MAG: hypothetical protein COZ56_16795 [Armatimonadetes bacterium CG_4_8_14_3_um_filter_58_9]|nr:MAG: hypothetical protein COZ56_16795 [Armatimonadetes bacterium CG_4_8_14_3_um_filter_58_9]
MRRKDWNCTIGSVSFHPWRRGSPFLDISHLNCYSPVVCPRQTNPQRVNARVSPHEERDISKRIRTEREQGRAAALQPLARGVAVFMNEMRLQSIVEELLSSSRAEATEITVSCHSQQSTRWANNAITQNITKTDESIEMKAAFGARAGSAATNQFDSDALRQVVEKAEAIAKASEPDAEYMPPVMPMSYVEVRSFHPKTAASTPQQRAQVIEAATALCAAKGLTSAGSFAVNHKVTTVANCRGLYASHPSTTVRFTCTAMADDSSGWAEAVANDIREMDFEAIATTAVGKALASRHPVNAEPKRYTVILEPAAVAELLGFMAWSMDARAAHEGRSAFAGKEGKRVAAPAVCLRSQPDLPGCPVQPFHADGMPVPAVTWVNDGTLRTLAYSRYWAQKQERPFTGMPTNFILKGKKSASVSEMVSSTEEGLLVSRFWYVRFVDPMKLLLTGMTRDGLFLIRDGKIVSAVKNLRFNESPLSMLAHVEEFGHAQRCGEYLPSYVPTLKVREFNFTSGTTF